MPRRRVAPRSHPEPKRHPDRVVTKVDGSWHFRPLRASSAAKEYRCPGCDHVIRVSTPHVVVWPVEKSLLSEAAIDERRHWHTACWSRRH